MSSQKYKKQETKELKKIQQQTKTENQKKISTAKSLFDNFDAPSPPKKQKIVESPIRNISPAPEISNTSRGHINNSQYESDSTNSNLPRESNQFSTFNFCSSKNGKVFIF